MFLQHSRNCITTLLITLGVLTFTACEEKLPNPDNPDGGTEKPENPENPQQGPVLRLEQEVVEVSSAGGNIALKYTIENPVQDATLKASVSDEWVNSLFIKNDKIYFSVALNEEMEPRTTNILFTYNDQAIDPTLKVSQAPADHPKPEPEIDLDNYRLEFPAEGGKGLVHYTLTAIEEDAEITVKADNEWVTDLTMENGEISFNVPENNSDKSRETNVVIRCEQHQVSNAFAVYQEPNDGKFNGKVKVNGVEFNMILVEGGTFQMGGTDEQGSDITPDEQPVHTVQLSDYYIGQYEVTQELWEAVMGENPSFFTYGPSYPVETVSTQEIKTFINKLCTMTEMEFALPTEAQWEFAARGGNQSKGYKYSGGNEPKDVAWFYDNSEGMTHPVGTKLPNELGIYDMSGNVCEWCSDMWGAYSNTEEIQIDPQGPSDQDPSKRIIRGGSADHYSTSCRVSYRNFDYLGNWSAYEFYGFRLMMKVPVEK